MLMRLVILCSRKSKKIIQYLVYSVRVCCLQAMFRRPLAQHQCVACTDHLHSDFQIVRCRNVSEKTHSVLETRKCNTLHCQEIISSILSYQFRLLFESGLQLYLLVELTPNLQGYWYVNDCQQMQKTKPVSPFIITEHKRCCG